MLDLVDLLQILSIDIPTRTPWGAAREEESRAAARRTEDIALYAFNESQRADRQAAELDRARRQVEVLEMAVEEMYRLCREAGVDDDTIRTSVEEAVRELDRATAAHAAAVRSSADLAEPGPHVRCVRCQADVPARATVLTESGAVCDSCVKQLWWAEPRHRF